MQMFYTVFQPGNFYMSDSLCFAKHNSYIQKSILYNCPLKKTLDLDFF